MNKFNKVKFCALVVFIVLLLASVQATSKNLDEVSGNGTEGNPYIIDVSGRSMPMVTFQYDTMPFYFVVKDGYEGSYEVSFDSVAKTVSFRFLESASDSISVMLDQAQYVDVKNWQVGVDTRINDGAGAGVPTYNITEELEYYSSYNEFYAKPPSMFGDSVTYLSGIDYLRMHKSTKLYNIVIDGYYAATKPNQYFFTTSTSNYEDAKKQLEAMGYTNNINIGLFNIFHNTKDDIEEDRDIYLANSYYGDNNKATRIVYKFNGNTNTALNDTGEEVNGLEALITRMFLSAGDFFLNKMIRGVLGSDLSVDSLIFDKYEPTKLNLYNTRATGINAALRNVINYWYGVLSNITYIAYVIILVYIGITVIISAGTEKQSKIRSNLTNWVVGLVILLFLPTYGIPLLFNLNKAFVTYMGRGSTKLESYYNVYDEDKEKDILGSDSATVSIEELVALKEDRQSELEKISGEVKLQLEQVKQRFINQNSEFEGKNEDLVSFVTEGYIAYRITQPNDGTNQKFYDYFIRSRILPVVSSGHEDLSNEDLQILFKLLTKTNIPTDRQEAREFILNKESGYEPSLQLVNITKEYEKIYALDEEIDYITAVIESRDTDIMGTMRAYAGKYQRLVFAFIWFMLIFQLIGLAFLYFKRLFVIAILITVFPLIMLFYCIDKMNDGSAQTLSLWFKELLSNIFIQSVHAVIYVVLVEMGLNIYINDPGNWIFLVAAMLMILPAESIMKELFGLNGSTLRAVGGALMKTALAIGTAKAFLTAFKGGNDASIKEKNNKRFDKLQKRQNRADTKAKARAAKSAVPIGMHPELKAASADASFLTKKAVGAKNAILDKKYKVEDAIRSTKVGELASKAREGAYHLGTDLRKFRAKAAPDIDAVARYARNTAALTAGLMYGAAGGDIESMAQGAQIAKALSGKTKNLSDEDMKLKTELKSAYNRKK